MYADLIHSADPDQTAPKRARKTIEEQSDQGLHCLLFLHHLEVSYHGRTL